MNRQFTLAALVLCLALLALALSPGASRARPESQEQPTPGASAGTPLPDLLVSEVFSELEWNRRCWDDGPHWSIIDVQIENRGEGHAGHFVVLGEDGHPTPVPWEVDSLPAGEKRWLGLRRGGAQVLIVDPDNDVAESDETNNRVERRPTYMLTQPPTCSPTPEPGRYLPALHR